jgi:DNA transformation protein
LHDQLHGLGHITTRRMFSGAAIYCDGVVFALVLRDVLYFKVDDGNRSAYEAEGLEPFIYQSRGKSVRMEAYRRACRNACSMTPTRCWHGHAPARRRTAGAKEDDAEAAAQMKPRSPMAGAAFNPILRAAG